MADPIRITGRPDVPQGRREAPELNVSARPNDYLGGLPRGGGDLDGLVRGLSALNPELSRYFDQQASVQAQEGALAGRAAAQKADLAGASPEAPVQAPVDAEMPQAYGAAFKASFKGITADRIGIEAKAQAADEYAKAKDVEGFNPDSWLAERRSKLLGGVTDPQMADVAGRHFSEFEAQVRNDQAKILQQRREQARFTAASKLAGDAFTADMGPDEWAERFESWYAPQAKSLQLDRRQAAGMLFSRALQVSEAQNGMPELFDVFSTRKDPDTGLSMIEMDPQLAAQVKQARDQAKRQSDGFVMEHTEQGRAQALMQYRTELVTNPFNITPERILADGGKFGALPTAEAQAAMWANALEAQQRSAAGGALSAHFDDGTLWALRPEDQKKVLNDRLGGAIGGLVQAVKGGDQAAIQQLAGQLTAAHSRSGATVPVEQLEQFLRTNVTNLPNAAGPTPSFLAAAEVYKALSADPQYREMYFKDDPAKVMQAFVSSMGDGGDPKTAYAEAYRSISPEAKAASEQRLKDPKVQQDIAKRAAKYAEGSSWWPRWLGGNGRPENAAPLGIAAQQEARSFLTRNPDATDALVQDHIESWSAKNYALDETSGLAVKVPPGLGGPQTQQALTNFSKDIAARLKAEARMTEDAVVTYVPTGTEGQFDLVVRDGLAYKSMGQVNLQSLIDRERSRKVLTEPERAMLGTVRAALIAGQPLPDVPQELLGKARAIGFLRPEEDAKLRASYQKQFMSRVASVPALSFGAPSTTGLAQTNKPMRVDHQLTARTALEFAAQPVFGPGQEHVGLASSLVTMGEAMVLTAYDDPARGAGKNIGMGYNLKANEGTVNADLKRAGVPVEQIQNVIDGKVSLLPDQAKRLLQVALPRYEKQARAVAEETSSGLWDRMTAPQKAVMVDIAWQVGDPGKFKQAWASLAAGKDAEFAQQVKVFYTNRSGERVEDTRRGNLRANMLSGISQWNAIVSRYGNIPSSKLQATAAQQ